MKMILSRFTVLFIIISVLDFLINTTSLTETELYNYKMSSKFFILTTAIYLINQLFKIFEIVENKRTFRFFIIDLFLLYLLARIFIAIIMFLLYRFVLAKFQYPSELFIENFVRIFLEYTSFSFILIYLLKNQKTLNFFTNLKQLILDKKLRHYIAILTISNLIYIFIVQEIEEQPNLFLYLVNYIHIFIQINLIFRATLYLFKNESDYIPYGV